METVRAATCSIAIRNTGKRVDLGLFTVISPLCIRFSLEISGDLSQVKFISPVRQFHGKANSLKVIPPKYVKIWESKGG